MDPSSSIDKQEDDDDVLYHSSAENPPESSASASTHSDPSSVHLEPPNPPSPATTLRRRRLIRLGIEESSDSGADIHSTNDTRRKHTNLTKGDNSVAKPNSDEALQVSDLPVSVPATEEITEESIVTTAANDGEAGDSADSALRLGDSSSSFLEFIAGLVIKALGFQIKLIFMFMTYPLLFLFRCWLFFIDPFGTTRKGKEFFIRILCRVCGVAYGYIRPSVRKFFKKNDTVWSVVFRLVLGFLWSIYVCCILIGLLVSSFVFSGFLMKHFVEKPIHMKEDLNFDYAKHSPVAYVPIISCAGVVNGKDSENNVQVGKLVMGERIIPSNHKVQVAISLKVPESGYNRNLGVFQARVDFLLSNGKTIASMRQPCMLKFRSEPIRLIMTFLKIAPLVTGYVSETQTLNVKMRGFVERDTPTSCLRVMLEQRAEYLPGAGIPEIYDAFLVIESELPFFKRIIWHWKMSVYIWITMMTFFTELMFVLVCCRPIIMPRTRRRVASARGPSTLNSPQARS